MCGVGTQSASFKAMLFAFILEGAGLGLNFYLPRLRSGF